MDRDYVREYGDLLRKTLREARAGAFFQGYKSPQLQRYLSVQKNQIWALEDEAMNAGQKIHTRENLNLASKLFGLEVKVTMANLQYA
jgi:hypothetical protein